jgi:cytochrome c-type biogenesis protein CcmH/NrfF
MCGGCARDLLSTCACPTADDARADLRAQLAAGQTKDQIILAYQKEYGSEAISVPRNEGAMRAIYAVPLVAIVAGGAGVVMMLRRWKQKPPGGPGSTSGGPDKGNKAKDDYDRRLDEELKDLDG